MKIIINLSSLERKYFIGFYERVGLHKKCSYAGFLAVTFSCINLVTWNPYWILGPFIYIWCVISTEHPELLPRKKTEGLRARQTHRRTTELSYRGFVFSIVRNLKKEVFRICQSMFLCKTTLSLSVNAPILFSLKSGGPVTPIHDSRIRDFA